MFVFFFLCVGTDVYTVSELFVVAVGGAAATENNLAIEHRFPFNENRYI